MSEPIKVGMKPPHVGSFIFDEILEPLNLTIGNAAEVLQVRRATLSDLINEKASLSPEMALRIEMAFGVDMDMLLNMQKWYDIDAMRSRATTINVQRYEAA